MTRCRRGERVYGLLDRSQSGWWDLFGGNHALTAQKVKELSQRASILWLDFHVMRSRSQISNCVL
ncbi:MAG: hypothetical protein DMG39_26650 [Acidobacteria bacterium]|nr:MAG: hypothetical protein DMG39_26650 [Acidobacteriota bacterium]